MQSVTRVDFMSPRNTSTGSCGLPMGVTEHTTLLPAYRQVFPVATQRHIDPHRWLQGTDWYFSPFIGLYRVIEKDGRDL